MTQHHHSHKLTTVSTSACSEEEAEEWEVFPLPMVFDADFSDQQVPADFNAVKIRLKGTMQSDLVWNEARESAERCSQKGLRILWEMDLGLFDHLKCPLGDQTQFLALCLSLDHFRDTLWKQFKNETVGICLYRGSVDFSANYRWDEEQLSNLQDWLKEGFNDVDTFAAETGIKVGTFDAISINQLLTTEQGQKLINLFCRDAIAEYLDLLARRVPDTLKCLIMLDSTSVEDPLMQAQLTINERYPNVSVAIKEKQRNAWSLSWEGSSDMAVIGKELPNISEQITIGICLPSVSCRRSSDYQGLNEVLLQLKTSGRCYRIVAESYLTTEWDGLDYLIVAPQSMSIQGLRKLRGFCAAGGTVVSLEGVLGVAQEVSITDWISTR